MRNQFVSIMLLTLLLLAAAFMFAAPPEKVVICHHNLDDPSEPEWITIEVSQNAVPAHLAHGDIVGACVVE